MIEGVHILGVRHHGPGSARGVLAALEAVQPQAVLIEGPPDADELIALAAHAEMRPPVALLIYRADDPKRASFYPFAEFSPEWQAIRWAAARGVPVRFMDLPMRHRLASAKEEDEDAPDAPGADAKGKDAPDGDAQDKEAPNDGTAGTSAEPPVDPPANPPLDENARRLRRDPLAALAEAAGYTDSERWWEEQFEKRHAGLEWFQAITGLMAAARETQPIEPLDLRREAWMRQTLREVRKEGHAAIAAVCGAWHAPALADLAKFKAKDDAELVRGLPKVTVAATWLPWTHRRLTFASGYGAGIHSPGYYGQLWSLPDRGELTLRWMTRVAHLLRAEDLESSTASIIEATRLAEATAAMRGRALPGLPEFNDAAQAVFCFGDVTPMRLIHDRLIVGDALGGVPADAPQVPLQRDFQKEVRRLRLPPEALEKVLDLDLRKPNDLDRSRLLHRLGLLRVGWGRLGQARGKGTFRETWRLRWEPELEVALIEAAPWGNTVAAAAGRFAVERATNAPTLADLTALVDALLLAELPEAIEEVMRLLENQAALTSDTGRLMDALPPLTTAMRYGSVRQTDAELIGQVVHGLAARIYAGLGPACASLSDEAAAAMLTRINKTDTALATLADEGLRAAWLAALRPLAESGDHAGGSGYGNASGGGGNAGGQGLHGLVAGRSARLLFDEGSLAADAVAARLSRQLSRANAPARAAAWLEGFLSGSGLVLIHQPALWMLLDAWLATLTPEHFTETLPLLRRTFATFAAPERRQMGERARGGTAGSNPADGSAHGGSDDEPVDEPRAARVLPTLAALLGSLTRP